MSNWPQPLAAYGPASSAAQAHKAAHLKQALASNTRAFSLADMTVPKTAAGRRRIAQANTIPGESNKAARAAHSKASAELGQLEDALHVRIDTFQLIFLHIAYVFIECDEAVANCNNAIRKLKRQVCLMQAT